MNAQLIPYSPPKLNHQDYATILRLRNLKYKEVDQYYFQVGTIKKTQGWIIHISVIVSQIEKLLQVVLPELIKEKIPFKIIRDEKHAQLLLDARLGYLQVGKIISMYPENDQLAETLAQRLVQMTSNFNGPAVPTDAYLGGTTYVRYGSFNPVMMPGENGRADKHIYNKAGKLIKDPYTVPFEMPNGITWPFSAIPTPAANSVHVLNNTYLVTSQLKGDVKGRVFKTIRIANWSIKQAVVKEAKHDQSIDQLGRDITERLRWQYEVQRHLYQYIAVPKVFDFFEENGNSYYGMQYVAGEALLKFIIKSFEGKAWRTLPFVNRSKLLEYLVQVLNIIKEMHSMGYVHRDISPANFIVTKKGIVMIDLEGAYSTRTGTPFPPYFVGTPGFTPPEQEDATLVSTKGDVYSIGALIFTFFTGLLPGKFLTDHPERIPSGTKLFDLDDTICSVVTECLQRALEDRPDLVSVISRIQQYRDNESLKNIVNTIRNRPTIKQTENQDPLISKCLNTYNDATFAETDSLWHTNYLDTTNLIANRQVIKETSPSLFSGISGGLYIIARAKVTGFHTQKIARSYTCNYRHIQQIIQSRASEIPDGFYHGRSGMAVATAYGIKYKLLPDTTSLRSLVQQNLRSIPDTPTLATGSAGQCIAILLCREYLKEYDSNQLLSRHINKILETQKKDGSWTLPNGPLFTGLSNGMAGIALSLTLCYRHNPSQDIKHAVSKTFEWLDSQKLRRDGINLWRSSKQENAIDPWFGNGITGIAYCYLLADKIFQNNRYREIAIEPLNYLKDHLIQNNLTLANGLAGLGEVYLEANSVTNTDQYNDQIDWITAFLLQSRYERGNTCFWIVDDEKEPDGGLMAGNGGILHYLIRQQKRSSLSFPIFGDAAL